MIKGYTFFPFNCLSNKHLDTSPEVKMTFLVEVIYFLFTMGGDPQPSPTKQQDHKGSSPLITNRLLHGIRV